MILENKGHDPSAKSNTVDYELKKGHLYRKLPEKFVYYAMTSQDPQGLNKPFREFA